MSDLWLQSYLDDAVERRLCVDIGCTTCGAMEFRTGLSGRLALATNQPEAKYLTPAMAVKVARALAVVRPSPELEYRYAAATRYIMYKIWRDCGEPVAESQVWPLLGHSWAMGILESMKAHSGAVQFEREQRPKLQAQQREEKRRLKEMRQAERAARKLVRDEAWHAMKRPEPTQLKP